MHRPLLVLLLLLAACPTPAPSGDDDDATSDDDDAPADGDPWSCESPTLDVVLSDLGFRATSDRVQLDSVGSEAQVRDLAALVESALPAMEDFFGEDLPADRLPIRVELHPSEGSMLTAINAAGVPAPTDAGGYYHPSVQTSWLYAQPTRYFTQNLLLHEVAHQVHDLVRNPSEDPSGWWVEGIAEYLGRHDWDGECARLGQLPLATLEDMDARALDHIDDGATLGAVIDGDWGGRPPAYAAVRYLHRSDPQAFAALRLDLDEGAGFADPRAAVEAHYGALGDHDWLGWLEARQQPLHAGFQEWLHRTPTSMVGSSPFTIYSRMEVVPDAFSVTVPAPESGSVGVLVAWESGDDYIALLGDGTGWSTFESVGGQATWWGFDGPAPVTAAVPLEVRPTTGGTEVLIGGEAFLVAHELPFAAGLALAGGEFLFSELAWSP